MWLTRGWSLLLAGLLLFAMQAVAFGQKERPSAPILAEAQAAVLDHRYAQAIRILKKALKEFPSDNRLRVDLGRAYLLKGDDWKAGRVFRQVLQLEPENREAKLGLARALSHQGKYKPSNHLYRELLHNSPRDEAAAIGLASNLMNERRMREARKVVEQGLAFHPDSLVLQEFLDRLNKGEMGGNEPYVPQLRNRAEGFVDEASDSEGDKSLWATQRFRWQMGDSATSQVRTQERWLVSPGTPLLRTNEASNEIRLQLFSPLVLNLGGGVVEFPGGAARALYNAGLEIHPAHRLWLEATFLRVPFYPDAVAAQYDLTSEGWRTLFQWNPGSWTVDGWWSKQHYSDGNLGKMGSMDLMHWTAGRRVVLGAGYHFTQYNFNKDLDHGYFNPNKYQSHLAAVGIKFHARRVFHSEYLVRAGGESIKRGSPFRLGWEASARNRANFGHWQLEGDFLYFRLVQNTGAFQAQEVHFGLKYHF